MLVVSPARQKTLRKLTDSLRHRSASPMCQERLWAAATRCVHRFSTCGSNWQGTRLAPRECAWRRSPTFSLASAVRLKHAVVILL